MACQSTINRPEEPSLGWLTTSFPPHGHTQLCVGTLAGLLLKKKYNKCSTNYHFPPNLLVPSILRLLPQDSLFQLDDLVEEMKLKVGTSQASGP